MTLEISVTPARSPLRLKHNTVEIVHFGRIWTLRTVDGRSRGLMAPWHKPASIYLLLDIRKEIIRIWWSIQASSGKKSTSAKPGIYQDPDCAQLCAGPAIATSRFSLSSTKGVNRRNRHRVGMGSTTSAVPGTRLREETRGKVGIHGPRAGKMAQSDSIRDVADC
jgi:hypothetical protein